jgi:hypothetical protein
MEERSRLSKPKTTDNVPLVPFKVIASDIAFYLDEECSQEVKNARIVITQALDPEDQILEQDIMPTTQQYHPGQYVNLLLDHKNIWDECWYKDPGTGEVLRAWKVHVNYIGEVISDDAINREKERISDLEKKVEVLLSSRKEASESPVN